jgi:riboflavin kinase/FMN adenylyltransferase
MKKIKGIVMKGKGRGRKMGYPTVNLDISGMGLESGVYVGRVRIFNTTSPDPSAPDGVESLRATEEGKIKEKTAYRAGIFVSRDEKLLEAHLIGFNGDLYGREVEVEILDKIRDVGDFANERELKRQIEDDLKLVTGN